MLEKLESKKGDNNMVNIFISYSHDDDDLRNELDKHLMGLQREGTINTWDDHGIFAGEEFEDKINANLESADIILLLISSNFIASDYCYCKEMTRAMERHHAREAKVIPVILHPFDWEKTPFGTLKALPKDGKPVSTFPNKHEAFSEIAKAIRRVVEQPDPQVKVEDNALSAQQSTEQKKENANVSYKILNDDIEIKKIVSDNIHEILDNDIMRCVEQELRILIENKIDKAITRVSDELVNLPILDALMDLEKAVKKCFNILSIHSSTQEMLSLQWDASVNILGWLLLLVVSPEWRRNHKLIFEKDEEHKTMNFQLSVAEGLEAKEKKFYANIVVSSLVEQPVDLSGNKSDSINNACDLGIELGIDKNDSLEKIIDLIYRAVYKTNESYKESYLKALRARLRGYNHRNKHKYITVDIDDTQNSLKDPVLYQKLCNLLPELNFIYIKVNDTDCVLLIPENDVLQNIELFKENRPKIKGA